MDEEVEVKIKILLTPELKRIFSNVKLEREEEPKTITTEKLMLLGHDIIIEKTSKMKPLADFVQKFAKLDGASQDVLVFRINRLSLWKAAERHTADQVIDFLKKHGKSLPSDSLKRWIFGTMSQWDSLKIASGENYDYLESVDEKLMERVLSMPEVKRHIFRRLEPNKARITEGHRGKLKEVLIEKGYPVKDLGRYEEFEALRFELKDEVMRDPRYEGYQREAVDEFLKYGSGTIILPGGAGKTVIAVSVAAKLKAPTLVLATRSEICKQFYKEFLEKTTVSRSHIKYIDADIKNRAVLPITICTYQIARNLTSLWKRQWGLVVYDESQHVPAPIWSKTSKIQATRRLGLTATPVREDKQEKLIFSLIGPPVFEQGWIEMAEEGFIAQAKAYEVYADMSPKVARRYNHSVDEREKYILASTNPQKISLIKKLIAKHAGDKILILGYYVQGAIVLGKKLGIPVIYGEVPEKKRHELYEQFRRGEVDKLILTSVGEEGVDLPDANVLIEVCGLYGSRMAMGQRFGRILRPKEEGSIFYELISRGTTEEDFSLRRREFLLSKGYDFEEFKYD